MVDRLLTNYQQKENIMQSTITDESSRTTGTPKSDVLSPVAAINEALAEKVGQQKFRVWFKNSTKLTLAGEYLKVGVPNLFIATWIENHFLNEIHQAVRSVTGTDAKVTFTVDPELSGNQRRTRLDCSPPDGSHSKAKLAARSSKLDSRRASSSRHRVSRKLKLDLDTFVVGSSNELAYNAAKVVVNEQQSPFKVKEKQF